MLLRCLRALPMLAISVLSAALCPAAEDDSRPVCTSQIHGHMWPEAANNDPKLLAHLIRCAELFICVRGSWHYHWETPSVRIDQLGRRAKSKPSSTPPVCEVSPEASNEAASNAAMQPPSAGKVE
jgi:hypothetical protein